VFGLGRASRLDIVQHRRRSRGTLLGEKATVKVDQRRSAAPAGRGGNLAGAGAGDNRHRRRTGKAAELRPHFGHDIAADPGRNPAADQSSADLFAARRALAGQFAKRGLPGLADTSDLSRNRRVIRHAM
jgi:hypothetical protein